MVAPPAMPILTTPRLVLRPFVVDDAGEVQRLAGEREIAATTLTIPHPYPDGAAEEWIAGHQPAFLRGEQLILAITESDGGRLAGAISLAIKLDHRRAELGYWVGKPYWGRGYCTEAAAAMLRWGFETLALQRIHACHFSGNPASGRVMQKLGMKHEGRFRRHIQKWGEALDVEHYAILREELPSGAPSAPNLAGA